MWQGQEGCEVIAAVITVTVCNLAPLPNERPLIFGDAGVFHWLILLLGPMTSKKNKGENVFQGVRKDVEFYRHNISHM